MLLKAKQLIFFLFTIFWGCPYALSVFIDGEDISFNSVEYSHEVNFENAECFDISTDDEKPVIIFIKNEKYLHNLHFKFINKYEVEGNTTRSQVGGSFQLIRNKNVEIKSYKNKTVKATIRIPRQNCNAIAIVPEIQHDLDGNALQTIGDSAYIAIQ